MFNKGYVFFILSLVMACDAAGRALHYGDYSIPLNSAPTTEHNLYIKISDSETVYGSLFNTPAPANTLHFDIGGTEYWLGPWCAAGQTLPSGSRECSACAAGTAKSDAGNAACGACGAGYYSSGTGNTSCTQCTGYKYASGTGNTSCTLPPAGYNATGCSSGRGCTGQEPCGKSWYCPGDGQYYSCPSNSAGANNTPKSIDDCLCNAGYARSGNTCNACGTGTYKSSAGNTSCSSCTNKSANSTYTSAGGTSNTCKYSCNAGYYGVSDGSSGTCSDCGYGYYCTGGNSRSVCAGGIIGCNTKNRSSDASSSLVNRILTLDQVNSYVPVTDFSMWEHVDSNNNRGYGYPVVDNPDLVNDPEVGNIGTLTPGTYLFITRPGGAACPRSTDPYTNEAGAFNAYIGLFNKSVGYKIVHSANVYYIFLDTDSPTFIKWNIQLPEGIIDRNSAYCIGEMFSNVTGMGAASNGLHIYRLK